MLLGIVLSVALAGAAAPDTVPAPRVLAHLSQQIARGHGQVRLFTSRGRFVLADAAVSDSGVTGHAVVRNAAGADVRVPWSGVYTLEAHFTHPNPISAVGAVALGAAAGIGGFYLILRAGPEFAIPMVAVLGGALELGSKLGHPRQGWTQVYPEF